VVGLPGQQVTRRVSGCGDGVADQVRVDADGDRVGTEVGLLLCGKPDERQVRGVTPDGCLPWGLWPGWFFSFVPPPGGQGCQCQLSWQRNRYRWHPHRPVASPGDNALWQARAAGRRAAAVAVRPAVWPGHGDHRGTRALVRAAGVRHRRDHHDHPGCPRNLAVYGKQAGSHGGSGYPLLRLVALAAFGTRTLIGAVFGPASCGELVVRGGVEPPAFRFSGAYAPSLHVAGRGLIGDLAAETMARCRLMWPEVCRRWLPVWLPNLVSAANLSRQHYPETRPGAPPSPHASHSDRVAVPHNDSGRVGSARHQRRLNA
jgi:hypothetical protein